MVGRPLQDHRLAGPADPLLAGGGYAQPRLPQGFQDGRAGPHLELAAGARQHHDEAALQGLHLRRAEVLDMHLLRRAARDGRLERLEHRRRAAAVEV